jgi:hypothetical protein
MTYFLENIKNYFTEIPRPQVVFQVASRYLSGIYFSEKEKKLKHSFILPLPSGVIQPSFDKKNIQDVPYLEEKLKEGLGKLHVSEGATTCVIPELCLKAFLFSFDVLPTSQRDKEQIIRWRVQKQFPSLTDDMRFSFDVLQSENGNKILVSLARDPVIREYEDFFSRMRLKVKVLTVPAFSLFNLLDREKEKDVLIANVEEDSISLMAIINSEMAIYRLKPFLLDSRSPALMDQKIREIIKEIENTVNFIEDRDKKKISSIWIRLGLMEMEGDLLSKLASKISLALNRIEPSLAPELRSREKELLAPLFGQVL